ncbi:helix-turn-helix domain-containing protein [Natronoglycomyces albus]|uniref:HTH luxR-type domain-containing protein n=1 Tax=Natronoglycomyces albus TaxID=2811108 RepID=A0A895XRW7_9ACTN|nr:helix-turn-helix domain-containing protein [Natronoglycomyces albus]QSB05925.1 hypothetical protein JQS30_03085 [Natronoglycomyces albus]
MTHSESGETERAPRADTESTPNPSLETNPLDPATQHLYRLLLSRTEATAGQLAAEAAIPVTTAQHQLENLVRLGMATLITDSHYRAQAPEVALGAQIGRQLDAVRSGYGVLQELLEIYRDGNHAGSGSTRWESVTGQAAIQTRLWKLESSAERLVRNFVKSPIVLEGPINSRHPEPRPNQGAHQQILYERGILNDLDDDPHMDYLHQCLEGGDEVRFAAQLPVKLVLFDDRILAMPEPPTGQPRVLITSHPPIVALAVALFEQLWMSSVPAPHDDGLPRDRHAPSEEDRLLLSLLIAGLTDQAIATRLGIGLRTVQRRVRELMNLAEVDTRIQLGWQAARRNWVIPDPRS